MSTSTPNSAAAPPIKLSLPLAYQQEIFHAIRAEDQLVILARGLGLLRIVSNFLHACDAAGENLVLVVGASEVETEWIGEALAEQNALSKAPKAKGLRIVTTDAMSVEKRNKSYARGGVFCVTSRILQVDLLKGNVPPEKITGMVVLHADRVVATSPEAFILRLFRQKNKKGFIKAFSDAPEPFSTGFAPLGTMMKNLQLRTPSLWPRFHLSVADSLENSKAEVVELNVAMTDAMQQIQTAILQCIQMSLSEIRKGGNAKEIDMEDWTVESALHRNFDVVVRRQLDPVWHRVSWKTRQIVGDLKELREMLHYLVSYDCVSFYQYLESILAAQSANAANSQGKMDQSPYLFEPAAQIIFTVAKERAYTGKLTRSNRGEPGTMPAGLVPVLEEQPKWSALSGILDEIERESMLNPSLADGSYGTVLVMCSDSKECRQLREYLQTVNLPTTDDEDSSSDDDGNEAEGKEREGRPTHSATFMLRRRLRGYLNWKRDLSRLKTAYSETSNPAAAAPQAPAQKRPQDQPFRGRAPANKRRRVRGGAAAAAGPSRIPGGVQPAEEQVASLWETLKLTEEEEAMKADVVADPLDNMDDFYELFELHDLVVVHPFRGDMDDRLLEELRPRFIVMYSPDPAFVRRVEIYRSSHNDRVVKVYFMYYGDSVEEQRFLSAVRKEKDAFSKLIKEKSTMAVTITTDPSDLDPQEVFLRTLTSSRLAGGRLLATAEHPRVIVDMREFRSSLPSLLHARGMDPQPVTLTVGDYILTPDICVERKSIKDLIASFRNGRLYTQCEAMVAHYKVPVVLIEFDMDKSFCLDPISDMPVAGGAGGGEDLQGKIVALSLAFPNVRFVWSSSPYQTAEIFEDLKTSNPQPDAETAAQIGQEEGDASGGYNSTAVEMLRAVPGITPANWRRVAAEVENMVELSNMPEQRLAGIIGKEIARKVVAFFNRKV